MMGKIWFAVTSSTKSIISINIQWSIDADYLVGIMYTGYHTFSCISLQEENFEQK